MNEFERRVIRLENERRQGEFVEGRVSVDVQKMVRNALNWTRYYTKTRNEHWVDERRPSAYEPFPPHEYFEHLYNLFDLRQIILIEKSRDVMISWASVAYLLLNAMKVPNRGVIFQAQTEKKVSQLVDYAKCLYRQSHSGIQEAFPLSKSAQQQSSRELTFRNGSYIIGIPGGADQIRSYHPWAYLNDESSFQADAGECFNEAISAVSGKIIFNSSAGPGWYADALRDIVRNEGVRVVQPAAMQPDSIVEGENRMALVLAELSKLPPQTPREVTRGLQVRMSNGNIAIARVHYSVLPDRDPELNPHWKVAERRKYTSQGHWDREQEIVHEAGGGELVFADALVTYWDKIVIVDPKWRPDPDWTVLGGFDYGKTNPTAFLRAYIDFEGTIYIAGEYYQPGLEIWEHAPNIKRMHDFERIETIVADPTMFISSSEQSQMAGRPAERAKSNNQLYCEQGIVKFYPFGGDRSDVSFAGRLHSHWADLGNREATVKIICPEGLYAEVPQPGLHRWGCPNLLWELMRTRRRKLTAQQLLNQNTAEAIVDKDNHARDALKYLIMSDPEPSRRSSARRLSESLAKMTEGGGSIAGAQFFWKIQEAMANETETEPESFYYGRNLRRRIQEKMNQRRRRGW